MSQTDQAPVIVSLKNVRKEFENGTTALQDFSLEVRKGEFVSLLGPSGCGKSSALRIIAGLAAPSGGDVAWPQEAHEQSGHELGFVFQEATLMPWATVFSNVWLPLRIKGVSKSAARERVMDALETVGLQDFADHRPAELSGGMKMRVSIARALITRPKVLLMDEPFAALDEITRFKLNNDLMHLQESFGWTVLFVTHSVFESVYLSSRVVVMAARPGRVVCEHRIDMPRPRDDGFRTSQHYSDLCRDVSASLQASMEPADAF
ncbi:ABC transporter ATP-binding protein [Labrenzia sp. VG12]|uniref:ABC transporter ATP-binding protein n=1 Tax=Labrenzia sp. VG12 TaxID=2021862 RepID=UPI000B8BE17E|nr:ABC transporter ATP-binding protein [Labrenzia sp. VG12]ASP36926.1 nitrate/sulfonate/bicarbonate ABC transporter ATP-binding protein [Labrenzia sp. VG12]